jgi:regulator of sigma E protease
MLTFLLYSLLPFLFILAFSITIHEFGHFLIAKFFKIPVEKFSIGFGPPIVRKKIGETDFRIAYFPLGGYVKLAGEEEGEGGFYDASHARRIAVVFGGPLFNIVSAVIVLILAFLAFGISIIPYTKVLVEANSYAQRAGIINGDSICSVNNRQITSWNEFEELLSRNKEKEINLTVMRDGRKIPLKLVVNIDSLGIKPLIPPIMGAIKLDGPADKAGIKPNDKILSINEKEVSSWYELVDTIRKSREVSLSLKWQHENVIKTAAVTPLSYYDQTIADTIGQIGVFMPQQRKYLSLGGACSLSITRSWEIFWLTLKVFYQLITREVSPKALGGPIAIFKLSGESARWGFEFLLNLLVIISINLGIINLFPIPALDGGHIFMTVIEGIRKKNFSKETRIIIQQIGFAIILLLIIFVTFNDITR